ncbi:MAG: L-threonylcarbamoyladenylate synthase, partial [Vulcanimicrobiaceae bacterium]
LTLVLPRTSRASDLVTGSQDTVALRAPSHPLAHEILRAFGGGVVAPSANRFGSVSATRAEHVIADLGDAVDLVVDGGDATIGIESTIVDLAHGEPAILRPGGVTRAQIAEALGVPVHAGGSSVRVPGSLPSHYAPRARVELAENAAVADGLVKALRSQGLSVSEIDSTEINAFARDLYERLRAADRAGADAIVVVLPPNEGLGVALRDRLHRAAAPR